MGNKTKLHFGNNYNLDQLVYAPAYFYVNSTLNGTLNLTLPAYPFHRPTPQASSWLEAHGSIELPLRRHAIE